MLQQNTDADFTVLVVDDDEISLDIAQDMLLRMGVAQVHRAADGLQALKALRQLQRVDVVVVDIYMPDMDGIEFISELAQCGYGGKLIIVSGVNLETLNMARQIAQANGINVVAAIEKPLDQDALSHAMGFETA